MTVSSSTNVVILSADGSTHSFSFTFKIFAASDLKVIVRSAAGVETEKTLDSHYIIPTSSVGNTSGGNILFKFNTGTNSDAHYSTTDFRPANGEKVILRRQQPQTQELDLVDNDPFSATLIEEQFDKVVMQIQGVQETVDRSLKFSRSNLLDSSGSQIGSTYPEIEEDTTARANKLLSFDSTGTPIATQEIGTLRGDWAASTVYQERDIVKDTSSNNIFIVNTAHTSSGSQPLSTNANASKYTAIIDFTGGITMAGTLDVGGVVTANAGVKIDNFTFDGTEIDLSSGDLTIDVAGDINIDAGGANINFLDDGTMFGFFLQTSGGMAIGAGTNFANGSAITLAPDSSTGVVTTTINGPLLINRDTVLLPNAQHTLDCAGDLVIDTDQGNTDQNLILKDGGTTYASFTQASGELVIKSGSTPTTAITMSGANVTIAGDLTVSGDDLTMGTNTAGYLLVADGTNYNPVAVSGDVTMASSGAVTIASGAVENAMLAGSIADSKLSTITTADKVSGAAIQIDGATDGTSITVADADKFLIDDGGTTKYINASQLSSYIGSSSGSAADDISAGDAAVTITTTSGNITIDAQANDSNIIFKGTDNSADTTFLTLSGADAGAATFNSDVKSASGNFITTGSNIALKHSSGEHFFTATKDGGSAMYHDAYPVFNTVSTNGGAIGTTNANTFTLDSSNTFFEVGATNAGTIVLSAQTNNNATNVGDIRFANSNNGDDDGVDADGKMIARIISQTVTSDSNASDDSGGTIVFSTKPEAGSIATALTLGSDQSATFGGDVDIGGTITKTGNLRIDSSGTIFFDADSGTIDFEDGGTTFFRVSNSSTDAVLQPTVADKDLIFKGNDSDGGGVITALTLDMSEAGDAQFNRNVGIGGTPNNYSNCSTLTLNATNGGVIDLELDGNVKGEMFLTSSGFHIKSMVSDEDLLFQGNDGGSTITALTLDMSDAGTATFNHDIRLGDNGQVIFGDGSDLTLYSTGADATIAATQGALLIDVVGAIELDSDTGVIDFDDNTLNFGRIENSSSDFKIEARVQDKDIVLAGNDGGSGINALTLDMSEAGKATFNSDVVAANFDFSGNGGKIFFGGGTDDYLHLQDVGTSGIMLSLVQDNNTKISMQGTTGNATFAGSVTVGSSGLVFNDGTTQTTAASGSGGVTIGKAIAMAIVFG